ncbi:DUF1294 domain-containing protein [Coralloluteibacterium stylophorae]|uniref:Cold shock and DUF1294 domain-containing protein n=1 Tax=Coralloluteibacterium stylophorae TaxID=1776034 RepID=A0A8J7VSF2_9GAMM|nr:cold shock and DUF1294 domain-containing protein [Coralloluteibacterium stylophorae]MBS7457354.1 cold shock and DUF1294 domain-containing protein [Coralloluteibacterium stylophorae]
MRYAGRIHGWNDERGFGFVTPNGGGDRAFVHVSAFVKPPRRPVDGDLVSYEVGTDARGRLNAGKVRFAGQRVERPARGARLPRPWIAACAVVALIAAMLLGRMPPAVVVVYATLSLVSYLMYGHDKAAAGAGRRRTPEASLHLVDLLGGWPGALVAQHRFRHKTVKASFQVVFWFTVIANIGGVVWLLDSGLAGALSPLLRAD